MYLSPERVNPEFHVEASFEIPIISNYHLNNEPQFHAQSKAFYHLERLKNFEKIVKNVRVIETLKGVDEHLKKEEIENYLKGKVWEYEDILKEYGIEARNPREKYFALTHLRALLEDDLETGLFSREGISKEINRSLEKDRAMEKLVSMGLYVEKDGILEKTPDYRERRKNYSWFEVNRLEKKAGVKNRRWFAVAASLIMLGAIGSTGCVKEKTYEPKHFKDDDTLPDEWEMKYFGNLNQTPYDDFDLDGLNNLQEYQNGTNPTLFDTDEDGYNDFIETHVQVLDPLDPDVDKDGLKDGMDYDHDNLTNFFESQSDLYDPFVKNDRYVILVEAYWNPHTVVPGWVPKNYEKQYEFYNKYMRIPSENIYRVNHTGQITWTKFKKAVKNISLKSDENDFLFVSFIGHGGPWGFVFNQDLPACEEGPEPREVPYSEVNKELNKIRSKAQCILVGACSSESAIKDLIKTDMPRVIITDTNVSKCGGGFDLALSIYPSVLSSEIEVFYRHPAVKNWVKSKVVKIHSDKDKNGFVSIKEAFETARDVYFFGKHPDIPEELRIIHRYPHMSDLNNIADKFYFGDYIIVENLKRNESKNNNYEDIREPS